MYTDINSKDDEFNRMQEKIKNIIDNIVANPHLSSTTSNSSTAKNTPDKQI